jgi:hypothetical protein
MALWGKTDAPASVPKYLEDDANNTNKSHDKDNAVFVDLSEAGVTANRAKGLKTPGWNLYHTYTDQNSVTRHKAESLVVMKVSAADAGDLGVTGNTAVEDAIVADFAVTISTQPQDATANTGDPATFTVVATSNDPNAVITYQWETDVDGGTDWADCSGNNFVGATTDTLEVQDSTGLDDDTFRVVVTATNGVETVIVNSDAATLTVNA